MQDNNFLYFLEKKSLRQKSLGFFYLQKFVEFTRERLDEIFEQSKRGDGEQ